jgi:hypothetical protein
MKKELAAAERRLNARNDRIYTLEQLVTGQEHKLMQKDQRYSEELRDLKRQIANCEFHSCPHSFDMTLTISSSDASYLIWGWKDRKAAQRRWRRESRHDFLVFRDGRGHGSGTAG